LGAHYTYTQAGRDADARCRPTVFDHAVRYDKARRNGDDTDTHIGLITSS